jgi:glycosyltransferase involved in cell wall biosynthesis
MATGYTVVIPTYNEEKYIEPLLVSIDNQSMVADQVILVDGSDDRTRDIARQHGATILNQDVRRVSWARKHGFDAAKGRVIISSDADTILTTDYIKYVDAALSEPDVVAVFGPVYLQDGPWLLRLMSRSLFSLFLWLSVLIGRPNLNGMNFAVRREAYRKSGGFDPEMVTGEDVFLGLRLRKIGRIKYDSRVKVYTSARRIVGMGSRKFVWHHTKNFLRVATGRTSSEDFTAFR